MSSVERGCDRDVCANDSRSYCALFPSGLGRSFVVGPHAVQCGLNRPAGGTVPRGLPARICVRRRAGASAGARWRRGLGRVRSTVVAFGGRQPAEGFARRSRLPARSCVPAARGPLPQRRGSGPVPRMPALPVTEAVPEIGRRPPEAPERGSARGAGPGQRGPPRKRTEVFAAALLHQTRPGAAELLPSGSAAGHGRAGLRGPRSWPSSAACELCRADPVRALGSGS